MRRPALQFLALLISTTAMASGPPAETFSRLDQAVDYLDTEHFSGSYTFTTHSVFAKPNGKDRHEVITVAGMTKAAGEETVQRLIRAERDGEDVTEEFAERQAERRAKKEQRKEKDGEDDENQASVSLDLPSGDEFASYHFGPPQPEGEHMVAEYRPRDPKSDAGGHGRLAWNPDTLDPAWIEFTPSDNPRFVKRIWLRLELGRAGDQLFVQRVLTEGLGGILFIKREFEVETEVTDITLDPSQPTTGGNTGQ